MIRNLEFSRLYVTEIDVRLPKVDQLAFCQTNLGSDNSLSVGHLESGTYSLLDIRRGKLIKHFHFGSSQSQPTCLELARVGALKGFSDGQVAYSLFNEPTVKFFPVESSHTAPISALAFSNGYPETTPLLAASGCLDGLIILWDSTALRIYTKLRGLKTAIRSIILNAKSVLALDATNTLSLWKLEGGPEPSPITCGIGIQNVDFVLSGEAVLILDASGALERLDLETLERTSLSAGSTICYHLNPLYPKFVAIGRTGSASLTEIASTTSRVYHVRSNRGKALARPHAIYFDNLKLVSFYEDDTIRIWCVASGRQIRKLALRHHLPRHLASFSDQPIRTVAANATRLLLAIGKHVVVLGVGSESAHLASRPKHALRRKVNAFREIKQAMQETLQDLKEEESLNVLAHSKFRSLQDLSGLTEDEILQYALALSREEPSSKPALTISERDLVEEFGSLDLSEDEALSYAVYLSQQPPT